MSVALLCATGVVRAEVDQLVRDAQAATAGGQPRQAYDMLEPQEVRRAGDPDFDLAFGMAANAIGQFSRAIIALERITAVQPENMQARAELGRALFGVGDTKAARALLNESKLQGIPVAAGETIDQLLYAVDRVDAAGQSSLKGYVEAAIGHDSNANSGPADRNLAVPVAGGNIIRLNPSGAETSASYALVGGSVSGRKVLDPRWSLIGNASGSTRAYSGDASRFNTLQLDANGGVSYRVERDEYILAAQVGTYDIDGSRVRDLVGVVADWTHRFDGFRQFTLYGQLTRMTFPQQRIADVDRHVIGATYAHLQRSGTLFYGGAYFGAEDEKNAGVAHLGHKLVGARGGVQHPLSANLSLFVTASYERRNFGGDDPLFLITRQDRQTDASVGLSWVPMPYWRVTPQVYWAQTRSNIPIAAYDKTVVSVTARREF